MAAVVHKKDTQVEERTLPLSTICIERLSSL